MMQPPCARYFVFVPLFMFFASVVLAAEEAEEKDPYVKLFRVQQKMAEKGDPLAEYYLGEMHQEGLGTKVDLEQAILLYKRSAAKGNALAKKRLADIEREQAEAEKAKQRTAERAREIAAAKAREQAEAEAQAKRKAEVAQQKPDPAAKQRAEAEAARQAKREEEAENARLAQQAAAEAVKREARRRAILDQVRRAQQERAKQGGEFW